MIDSPRLRLRLPAPIRVALISLVFGLVITLPVLLFVYHQTDSLFEQRIHDRLDDAEHSALDAYSASGPAAMASSMQQIIRTGQLRGGVVLLVDPRGHKIAGNLSGWPPVLPTPSQWNEFRLYPEGQVRAELFAIRTIALPGGERLLLGTTIDERERMRAALVEALLGALLLAVPLGLIGGWVVLKVAERRARAIGNVATRIAGGDFSHRLDEDRGAEEFGMLAAAINAMLERIEELVEQLRLVTDSLAHDLRSPLTRMRANIERAAGADADRQQQAIEAVSLDIDRMLRLISATLEISSTEAGVGKQHFENFDLAGLLRDICEIYNPLAEERGMEMAIDAPPKLAYTGNRQSIGRAVANLADNAVKYGGGSIELGAADKGEFIDLWVADRGPGISPDLHEHALGKYRRLEESRTTEGSGLGLALARAVARLHGGEIELQDNAPGLRVVLRLRRDAGNLSLL
ncbi:MAG TPA: HAMP domain-containing sensor histidine kinase [Sphingomicrobium sp.]|nr:HAMP domain-containing sensor histidine kinase [Sphingomicrobium sp.]